ncbi:hypothetical protein ISCGN_033027 [Ixodes scapularis]
MDAHNHRQRILVVTPAADDGTSLLSSVSSKHHHAPHAARSPTKRYHTRSALIGAGIGCRQKSRPCQRRSKQALLNPMPSHRHESQPQNFQLGSARTRGDELSPSRPLNSLLHFGRQKRKRGCFSAVPPPPLAHQKKIPNPADFFLQTNPAGARAAGRRDRLQELYKPEGATRPTQTLLHARNPPFPSLHWPPPPSFRTPLPPTPLGPFFTPPPSIFPNAPSLPRPPYPLDGLPFSFFYNAVLGGRRTKGE